MVIDTHAHLTSSELYLQVDEVLERARLAGIKKIINIATDRESLDRGLVLSKTYPWVFNAAAVHPHDAEKEQEGYFESILQSSSQLVAIGETGLDYFYHNSPKERQKSSLKRHLELASTTGLPVIIHCREAFQDFFEILDQFPEVKGVLHCFTGTSEEAQKVIEKGFYLSLSGIVTFKKSVSLQEVAKQVSLERLLVETDAPYLAPQSKRGKTNEPSYLVETAQFLADLRGDSFEKFCAVTANNAESLFLLDFAL